MTFYQPVSGYLDMDDDRRTVRDIVKDYEVRSARALIALKRLKFGLQTAVLEAKLSENSDQSQFGNPFASSSSLNAAAKSIVNGLEGKEEGGLVFGTDSNNNEAGESSSYPPENLIFNLANQSDWLRMGRPEWRNPPTTSNGFSGVLDSSRILNHNEEPSNHFDEPNQQANHEIYGPSVKKNHPKYDAWDLPPFLIRNLKRNYLEEINRCLPLQGEVKPPNPGLTSCLKPGNEIKTLELRTLDAPDDERKVYLRSSKRKRRGAAKSGNGSVRFDLNVQAQNLDGTIETQALKPPERHDHFSSEWTRIYDFRKAGEIPRYSLESMPSFYEFGCLFHAETWKFFYVGVIELMDAVGYYVMQQRIRLYINHLKSSNAPGILSSEAGRPSSSLIGHYVVAKSAKAEESSQSGFYRGRIEEIYEKDRMLKVFWVDFGGWELLPETQVYPMPEVLATVPLVGMACRAVKYSIPSHFTDKSSVATFQKTFHNNRAVSINFVDSRDGLYLVQLKLRSLSTDAASLPDYVNVFPAINDL